MQLNKNQSEATFHMDGPALVLAGPGSGKTAVLTRRIKYLCDKGIPPSSILVITFTKAASVEMKQRFDSMCEKILPVNFGTFHSCFYNILKTENYLKGATLITGANRLRLIKDVVLECGITDDSADFFEEIGRNVSIVKNTGNVLSSDMQKYVEVYEKKMASMNYIDFDDMLLKAYTLFKSSPDILSGWQSRFSYFLIDEAQDMNRISYELIRLISHKTRNIFMVGDDDQSIYGFRGSDPGILMQYVKDYPDIRQILLNVNYRCPKNIVNTSLSLISNNQKRFTKAITPNNPAGEISVFEFDTDDQEATAVVQKIRQMMSAGADVNSIAILYRNHSIVHKIVDQFVSEKISFNLKDNIPNIYTHWIMCDFEAFFFIALGNVTRERLLRVLNRPNQFIARNAIPSDEILYMSNKSGISPLDIAFANIAEYYNKDYMKRRLLILSQHYKRLARLRPLAAINYIRKNMGYDEYLKEAAPANGTKYENYLEIMELLMSSVKRCSTLKSAIDHLYTLRREVDYKNTAQKSQNGGVSLLTLHSSKGLEFENVFIIGCNEGILPASSSLKSESLIEEERRLFYVGITRSKLRLFITYRKQHLLDKMQPSRFIAEMNIESQKENRPSQS